MAWATSDRRQRLPPNWQATRAQVRATAQGRCEATTHDPDCDGRGTDADHITPGDDHRMTNLSWLSAECHKAKTARETAERNSARAAMRRRTPERHPGAID